MSALLAAALSLPSIARAAPCSIDAALGDAPAWTDAALGLSELALTDADCVSVRIELAPPGARVLFTTKDGRTAERYVATPEELQPTVGALRVQAPGRSRRARATSGCRTEVARARQRTAARKH